MKDTSLYFSVLTYTITSRRSRNKKNLIDT